MKMACKILKWMGFFFSCPLLWMTALFFSHTHGIFPGNPPSFLSGYLQKCPCAIFLERISLTQPLSSFNHSLLSLQDRCQQRRTWARQHTTDMFCSSCVMCVVKLACQTLACLTWHSLLLSALTSALQMSLSRWVRQSVCLVKPSILMLLFMCTFTMNVLRICFLRKVS